MKLTILLMLAALLLCTSLSAQQNGVRQRGDLPVVALGEDLTVHFLSPEPIQYVDISSHEVTGDLPVENLLRIRISNDSLGDHSAPKADLGLLTVVGESFMAQYNLRYSAGGEHRFSPASVKITPRHTTPLVFPEVELTRREMKTHALFLLSLRKSKPARKTRRFGMEMQLNGIYTIGGYIFLDISFRNRTNLPYDVDELRFSIDDRKIVKATNVQSLQVNPVWQLYPLDKFKSRHRNIFVLEKLTFPGNKVLTIHVTEKQVSGRTLTLEINYRDLLNADTL